MEDKPTLLIEIWRKIGEYTNARLVIDYEVKTKEANINIPRTVSEKGSDDKIYLPVSDHLN